MKLASPGDSADLLARNVFVMIICIDARIPLILVGKPGSSKSLAMQVPCDTSFVSKRRALASPKYAARLKQWLFWLVQLQLFHRLQE